MRVWLLSFFLLSFLVVRCFRLSFVENSNSAVMVEIHIFLERDTPTVDSVSDLWFGANWHEREAFDLMGIYFIGHPDLRRVLLPEGFAGHPLRKDYVYEVHEEEW